MNINKLIEKKNIDFDLTKAKDLYKNSNSFNKKLVYDFIDGIITEINKEYEFAISTVNLANKKDPLNVFIMATNISNKELISNIIINNRKASFEFKYAKEFTITDIDFIFEAYSIIVTTVAKEYMSLRQQVFELIKEAKKNPNNEF